MLEECFIMPQRLRELMAGGETPNVEFKGEEKRPLTDRELVGAVVCLANRAEGSPAWLLVGVEDDGRITGARPRHEAGRTDPARLTALIASDTRPSLTVRVQSVAIEGKDVLAIEVPSSRTPVGTAAGRYLRRAMGGDGRPECRPMLFHQMQALQADRGQLDYSGLVVAEARWEDLDPLECERFRRSIRESRGRGDEALLDLSDLELAKALGAVVEDGQGVAVHVLGLLHRDYTRLGAVHVQWHEDRIEIANPGRFPEGVRLDNLLVTAPQMVLQFVEKHGRITRREVAERCRISADQAYRLLTRLLDEGQLVRHGRKKGLGMRGERNITARGYQITARANIPPEYRGTPMGTRPLHEAIWKNLRELGYGG